MPSITELDFRQSPIHWKTVKETSFSNTRVETALQSTGIADVISPDARLRLVLLDRFTRTVEDEMRAASIAQITFRRAEEAGHPYDTVEQRAAIVGTLFSDIGKSGPMRAKLPQSDLIVSIYAQENITPDELAGTVTDFFRKYCKSGKLEEQLATFRSLRLDPDGMTMRDFYNLHTSWTLDILWGENGLPQEAIAAAASHHRLRGDNPRGILNDDDTYRFPFGLAKRYGRAEKLVGILDQYDALRRRSGLSHIEAVGRLKITVQDARDGRYAQDPEFAEIIADIDYALGLQYKN